MINDFKEVTAVVWVQRFSDEFKVIDAWEVGSPHKGYQEAKDSIGLFVNYKLVFESKNKEEALAKLSKLIEQVPKELKKDFEEFKHYLYEAIDGQ